MSLCLVTTCVSAKKDDLDDHDDISKDISLSYALKKIGALELAVIFPFYVWGSGNKKGLRLKEDHLVTAVSSKWEGKPCITIFHSLIHHIFQ